MQELLKFLITNLVKNPKDVVVEELQSETGVTLEITVNPEDMGLIIGKGGKVIKAIRNIVRTKAILEGKRVNVTLKEQN